MESAMEAKPSPEYPTEKAIAWVVVLLFFGLTAIPLYLITKAEYIQLLNISCSRDIHQHQEKLVTITKKDGDQSMTETIVTEEAVIPDTPACKKLQADRKRSINSSLRRRC